LCVCFWLLLWSRVGGLRALGPRLSRSSLGSRPFPSRPLRGAGSLATRLSEGGVRDERVCPGWCPPPFPTRARETLAAERPPWCVSSGRSAVRGKASSTAVLPGPSRSKRKKNAPERGQAQEPQSETAVHGLVKARTGACVLLVGAARKTTKHGCTNATLESQGVVRFSMQWWHAIEAERIDQLELCIRKVPAGEGRELSREMGNNGTEHVQGTQHNFCTI